MTSTARREQIVTATIDVIARDGYRQASFGRIAEQAGLSSTRLISYHFAGKDELMAACVESVVADIGEHTGRRLAAQSSAAGRLAAYIDSVVAFSDTHRASMSALLQIFLAGIWAHDLAAPPAGGHLEAILRQGQADGEFRNFDARVMAATVQRAVEAVPFHLEADPDLDCGAYARELVVLFDLATRRVP